MSKIIVITGASSGIGKELKTNYIKQNDTVINISLHADENELDCFQCDVSKYDELKLVFDKIIEKYNKIDKLINCAGYGLSGITELVPNDEAKKIFDVDFWGAYNCIKLALPYMDKGSKIVNISSACAIFPLPYRTLYCTAKSALSMLSQSWAMEIKHLGIQMTAICPGDIKTNFTKNRVKSFITNERYGNRQKLATEKIDAKNNKRMDQQKASYKIYKISQKNKYKPMYIVGFKYKLLYLATKIFPKSTINYFINKFFS